MVCFTLTIVNTLHIRDNKDDDDDDEEDDNNNNNNNKSLLWIEWTTPSYKSCIPYLSLHSVIQERLEDRENSVKNPGLVDEVNGVCPYWKTCLKTNVCLLNYSNVICPEVYGP